MIYEHQKTLMLRFSDQGGRKCIRDRQRQEIAAKLVALLAEQPGVPHSVVYSEDEERVPPGWQVSGERYDPYPSHSVLIARFELTPVRVVEMVRYVPQPVLTAKILPEASARQMADELIKRATSRLWSWRWRQRNRVSAQVRRLRPLLNWARPVINEWRNGPTW